MDSKLGHFSVYEEEFLGTHPSQGTLESLTLISSTQAIQKSWINWLHWGSSALF
jgi:hypothetical protein